MPLHIQEALRAEREMILQRGWMLCRVCGEQKSIKEFPIDARSQRVAPRCEKCRYAQYGSRDYAKRRDTARQKYNTYKNMARSRGYSFALTMPQFMEFWQKPCSYCGDAIRTIGIDRVDNSIGYEPDNCVPCCGTCNKMKRMQTMGEFMQRCKKILAKGLVGMALLSGCGLTVVGDPALRAQVADHQRQLDELRAQKASVPDVQRALNEIAARLSTPVPNGIPKQ